MPNLKIKAIRYERTKAQNRKASLLKRAYFLYLWLQLTIYVVHQYLMTLIWLTNMVMNHYVRLSFINQLQALNLILKLIRLKKRLMTKAKSIGKGLYFNIPVENLYSIKVQEGFATILFNPFLNNYYCEGIFYSNTNIIKNFK